MTIKTTQGGKHDLPLRLAQQELPRRTSLQEGSKPNLEADNSSRTHGN